jgi:glyoxylase-like metal-dependent hydrolase (beta-lactamase superfamily II)
MTEIQRRILLGAIGCSLLAGPVQAQGTDATPTGFAGKVFIADRGGVRIHTYMAAPDGALVTSHLIETRAGLVLVDGQFAPASAQELRRYIDQLGMNLARVLLSHQHPDHWFGLHHLGVRGIEAGPTTAAFLRDRGAALIAERRADTAVPAVEAEIAEGERTIGGVALRIRRVIDTEAPEMMVIEVPAAGAVIVQDLVYNRVHAVVSRQLANWIAVLQAMAADAAPTTLILAGHGEPTQPADLGRLIAYLGAVQQLMRPGATAEPIVAEMDRAFPDHRLLGLLRLGLSRALPV